MNSIADKPEDMAGKKRPQVLAEVQQLEQAGEFRKLYGYLTQLAKWGERPQQYEKLFARYLDSPEAGLREAAVVCLLVTLQIRNPQYRAQALSMVADETLDFDARLWAGSGLAVAYRGTKDPELLRALLAVVDDHCSNKYLQSSYLRGILLLMGLSARQQQLRAKSDAVAALQAEFAEELHAARIAALLR